MKKIIALAVATLLLFMVGCSNTDGGQAPIMGEKYVLKGIIKSVNDRIIEVKVIESDYAFGIYWVHTENATLLDIDGNAIAINDFGIDDVISITYGGQVMMSYPPQIVASRIQKI